jgi:hypothetical protein
MTARLLLVTIRAAAADGAASTVDKTAHTHRDLFLTNIAVVC